MLTPSWGKDARRAISILVPFWAITVRVANAASKQGMEIEQMNGKKMNFGLVLGLFAATILVAAVIAFLLVSWRAGKKNKPPFTTHPLSQLVLPGDPASRTGG